MSTAVADPRAARLAQLWSRLAAQHVTLGAGCGCMTGGVSVSLEDFELDIVDYLWAESERLGVAPVVSFLLAHLAYIARLRQDAPWLASRRAWLGVAAVGLGVYGLLWTGEGETVRALFPSAERMAEQGVPGENKLSIALHVRYGAFDYYTGGDDLDAVHCGDGNGADVDHGIDAAVGEAIAVD